MPVEALTENVVITRTRETVSFAKFMDPARVMRVTYAVKGLGVNSLNIPLADYTPEEARKRVLQDAFEEFGEPLPEEVEKED